MIDLNRFTFEGEIILPIINGIGKYQGRMLSFGKDNSFLDNGWYFVHLGEKVKTVRKARALEILRTLEKLSYYRVYALGEEGIAVNFDNLLKQGLEETIVVHFMNLQPFEVAKVVKWEDGRFYFYEVDSVFQRQLLKSLKSHFEKEESISSLKYLTPELRYMYLLLNLQRQSYRELQELEKLKLSEIERQKRIAEFQNSFQGRLHDLVDKAGGELIRYFKANKDSYMIHWKVKGSTQVVKSTIKDNFSILNLGFCASGQDKSHSMSSAIQLAKMYGHLYITRE